MKIFEEYASRHKLDVPLVHYSNRGSLLFRISSEDKYWNNKRWVILTFYWHENSNPGEYLFTWETPIHNAFHKGKLFDKFIIDKKLWHEYENYIIEEIPSFQYLTPVRGAKEIALTAWEMFVHQYDEFFLRSKTSVKNFLFDTIDKRKEISLRYQAFKEFCILLEKQNPALLKTWKFEVLMRLSKYSDWLAVIIENEKKIKPKLLTSKNEG